MKKIYIICKVRGASPHTKAALEAYADILEDAGHLVHLPHRDTDQEAGGLEICMENGASIHLSDEVHVFWDESSKGSHFDLGMAFMLDMLVGHKKKIRLIQYGGVGSIAKGDDFEQLLSEWISDQENSMLYDRELDEFITNHKSM